MELQPVDHDPWAASPVSLLPVDHDPFVPMDEAAQAQAAREVAAVRMRQAVQPVAGRQESPGTDLPGQIIGGIAKGMVDWASLPMREPVHVPPDSYTDDSGRILVKRDGQLVPWQDADPAASRAYEEDLRARSQWAPQAALSMMGATPFRLAPTGSLGMFAGPKAATADLGAMTRAQEMAASGQDAKSIWDATGWFQGADRKWRFEINDQPAQMNPNVYGGGMPESNTALAAGQIWHPELYEAYPQLRNIETTVSPKFSNAVGATGRYWGAIDAADRPSMQIEAATPAQARSVGLHELQHGVQDIEGFAKGASGDILRPNTPAWDIYQERLNAIRTPLSHEEFSAKAGYEGPAPAKDYADYLKTTRNIPPHVDRAAQEYAVRDAYNRAAGEVESRTVQRRAFMGPEERRANVPWVGDVPLGDQIVRFSTDGPQAAKFDTLQDLRRAWTDRGIDHYIGDVPKQNILNLSKMVVPKELRGQGIGSSLMDELASFADATGKTVTLSPSTDFGATSIARLKEFYRRFGFVENKGRHKDFTISESMYRPPSRGAIPVDYDPFAPQGQ